MKIKIKMADKQYFSQELVHLVKQLEKVSVVESAENKLDDKAKRTWPKMFKDLAKSVTSLTSEFNSRGYSRRQWNNLVNSAPRAQESHFSAVFSVKTDRQKEASLQKIISLIEASVAMKPRDKKSLIDKVRRDYKAEKKIWP